MLRNRRIMQFTPRLVAGLGVFCASLVPALASAQPAPRQTREPYRGIFGGDARDAESWRAGLSLSGAYDDNVTANEQGGSDPRFQVSGYFAAVDGSTTYQHQGPVVAFGVVGSTSFRYYPDRDQMSGMAHRGAAFLSTKVGERSGVRVSQSIAATPSYSIGLAPFEDLGREAYEPASGDYAIAKRELLGVQTSAAFNHQFTRRASFSMDYVYGQLLSEDQRSTRRQVASAGVHYGFSRYSRLNVGYGYREYANYAGRVTRAHDLLSGVDYSRPLSFSGRRTTFTVSPGASLVSRFGTTRLQLVGSAEVSRELGRSWTAQAQYQRGLRYVETLDDVVMTDGLMASLGGYLSRSVDLTFSGRFAGAAGRSSVQSAGGYQTYSGTGRVRVALSSRLAVFTQYLYYHYSFGEHARLPPGVGRELNRHGVRIGLSTWLPLLR